MKYICVIILLSFQLIPPEYQSRWNQFQHIIPNDNIVWWQVGICSLNKPSRQRIIYCSDSKQKIDLPNLTDKNTYCPYYFCSYPAAEYLVYKTKTGDLKLINDEKDLIEFIGTIDNLGEALFLASIYGYSCQTGRKFGSYRFKNDSYYLNLHKITSAPDVLDINENLIKAKLIIKTNAEIFEINRSNINKLSFNDMHRPL